MVWGAFLELLPQNFNTFLIEISSFGFEIWYEFWRLDGFNGCFFLLNSIYQICRIILPRMVYNIGRTNGMRVNVQAGSFAEDSALIKLTTTF